MVMCLKMSRVRAPPNHYIKFTPAANKNPAANTPYPNDWLTALLRRWRVVGGVEGLEGGGHVGHRI